MFNFKNFRKMNLENLNLVELNAQEMKEVGGGWGWAVWTASALSGSFLYSVIEDWDGNVAAFNDAYRRGRG
jgi:hypothetical protein